MPIAAGRQLGVYQVVRPLGAGAMGEVYLARDTRLARDVALKVLPDVFAADPERLARFEREAQALAALKHPHIATIHGFEDRDGVRALVLELVEGQTLAEMIAGGPLPINEAVRIARQIAEGLEAAHEQGIIHRDLKPANIKVTPDGAPEPAGPEGHFHPHGWSADGRELIATRLADNKTDLVRFAPAPGATVRDILATPQNEGTSAAVSPDGRWLAYTSDSTGRGEIWVRPLETPGPAVRVSPGGGTEPVWSKDGRELYYLSFASVLAVKIGVGPQFSFEPPSELFTLNSAIPAGEAPPSYDTAGEGKFVMIALGDSVDVPISVILNWTELPQQQAGTR